ncbi:hypothetical protein [Pseudonocardia sp. ICBG162]|uniref:hypothetical protein n=1 Tax=Pseudonocardia sp. ICBG162 TaxID=2846761 RepID=UPI001CF668FA|nr:hypothetical protein [Pseudonocardia sp. ICBG162]
MRTRRQVLVLGAAGLAGLAVPAGCGTSGEVVPVSAPEVPVRVRTRWAGRPAGPLPAAGDEGVPFTMSLAGTTERPSTDGRGLVGNLPDRPSAAYVMQGLPDKVHRIGARVGFGPGSAEGMLALVAWDPSAPMTAHCHFVLTPDHWVGATAGDGSLDELGRGRLSADLPGDGSPVTFEVVVSGRTVWVHLPDGSVTAVQGEAVERIQGSIACWEFYRNAPGGAPVTIYETWAG